MMKNSYISILILLFATAYLVPTFTFANGGDQRIVEGKFYINLSRAPFTPRVGVKTSFLASFVDIQKNKLVSEDLVVRIRISKLGDAPKGNFIFEKGNIIVKGGVLEFLYTFFDSGLHEIFFDFALASNPEKVYQAPDFLVDIQEAKAQEQSSFAKATEDKEKFNRFSLFAGFLGIIFGFFLGWIWKRKYL